MNYQHQKILGTIGLYLLVAVMALFCLFPFYFAIVTSLKSGTATRSAVASGIVSVTILSANAARKGATIFNSDANPLLLDLSGGVAAATRCQIRLLQYQTHALAFGFTGLITGIWEIDGVGQADVVEFT